MSLRFALVGNQNCGKSTLFNSLTGSNQHVGNFPGVTVQMKEGVFSKNSDITFIDLPGIYSLSPYSSEEEVTRNLLLYDKPDAIINVIDVTSIERSLYLTLQCIELNIPMIVALNMMDELTASGGSVDVKALEDALSVPVVPISAIKGDGVHELLTRAMETARLNLKPTRYDFCTGAVHVAVHAVTHLIEEKAKAGQLPLRFCATKLIEGDEIKGIELSQNETDIIEHFAEEMENELHTDKNAALADMRYNYIDSLCRQTVHKPSHTETQLRTVKIDSILTHKYFALPIFITVMTAIFWLTFDIIGGTLSNIFAEFLSILINIANTNLIAINVSEGLRSLVIDGICTGIASVLNFLPTIIILFFFLSLLEDSGYMARIAFVMDKAFRKVGLSGASFVPMLIGFGCSVPAIMATRTLASEQDRKITIILTPFMSCSAKLPIYGIFTAALFPHHGGLIMTSIYLLGIFVAIISGILLRTTIFHGKPVPFLMELPAYRIPSAKNVLLQMWLKAKDFIYRAFTIIFLASMLIWFLQNFNIHFFMVDNAAESILADIGKFIAPIFAPLGFGNWQASTALITGWTAKEVVISTLSVLTGTDGNLPNLTKLFPTLASAYSFLVFCLLYPPCFAAMATIKRELNSYSQMLAVMFYQIFVAWLVAFTIYNFIR
ncbi:MAG: ferrous iron transport protein B [Phascolarctobacterium sp.]|nr:ferrous iron transport protein B [Candidatus Phascolarctobacterium caballi]